MTTNQKGRPKNVIPIKKQDYVAKDVSPQELNRKYGHMAVTFEKLEDAKTALEFHGGMIVEIKDYRPQDVEREYNKDNQIIGYRIRPGAKKYTKGYLLMKPASLKVDKMGTRRVWR